jgi:hypothetical protein
MIVWNPRGFPLIKVLEKGRKFNVGYYITEILEPFSLLCESMIICILCMDINFGPHTKKLTGSRRSVHSLLVSVIQYCIVRCL